MTPICLAATGHSVFQPCIAHNGPLGFRAGQPAFAQTDQFFKAPLSHGFQHQNANGRNDSRHDAIWTPLIGYKITALFKAVEVMMIDWNEAPKGARWWAMDANGQSHWLLAPNVAPFTDFWYSDQVPAPSFGYSGNWKESLTERPDA